MFAISYFIVNYFIKSPSSNSDNKKHILILKRLCSYFLKTIVSLIFTIVLLSVFSYPKVVGTTNALKHPITVKQVTETKLQDDVIVKLHLDDGRILKCDWNTDIIKLKQELEKSKNQIEVQKCIGDNYTYIVWVSSPGGLCGNEFGCIPIIPIPRILSSRKYNIAYGEIENTNEIQSGKEK